MNRVFWNEAGPDRPELPVELGRAIEGMLPADSRFVLLLFFDGEKVDCTSNVSREGLVEILRDVADQFEARGRGDFTP